MKKEVAFSIFFICFPVLNYAQTIFSNAIEGIDPNDSNPYTIGQIIDSNITVSGIGRAPGMHGVNAYNRYDAKSWKLAESDRDTYFEFTLMPNANYKIDFDSFVFTGQVSEDGPTLFAFRSSMDGFSSDIGTVAATGSTVDLSAIAFQGIVAPVTFRLYGWAALAGTGAYSVNDFEFKGSVSCLKPEKPILEETILGCTANSFDLNWKPSLNASHYFIDVATDLGFINNLVGYQNKKLGNVSSETISVLIKGGTYYVRLKSGNSCGESAYSRSIKVAPPETVYNGNWSNGVPDFSKHARFSGNYNLNTDFEACSCQIDPGVAVHVDSGVVLRLNNELDVQGSGSLIFENNASLIQTNTVTNINSGSIIYKRISQPMKDLDYTYWSSPVSGQTLGTLAPLSPANKFYSWGITDWINESPDKVMDLGRGYIIRAPKTGVTFPYSQIVQFEGTPNNGDYVLTTGINATGRQNLIGNPYPSAVSADAFLQENCFDHPRLDGTIYFWTHNTPISSAGRYVSADYAAYNLTGGVATGKGIGTSAPSSAEKDTAPKGFIAAGQSFVVFSKGAAAGTVVFKNSMRVGSTGANDRANFFRGTKSKTATLEKHRVWLNLTNSGGAFKQLLVGYVAGATAGYDLGFDGPNVNGQPFVNFYSISESKDYTIQGRGLPFDVKDQVPLGYSTAIAGTFEISIDHADGSLSNQPVYVEDKTTSVIYNLKNGPYSFSTPTGTFNDRFVLRYFNKTAEVSLKNPDFDEKEKGLVVSVKNHKIKINSFDEPIDKVTVYDLRGSQLYDNNKVNANEFTIPNFNSSDQFLIVKIQLSSGKWIAKEIVF